jgi:hypothetical protein
LLSCNDFCIRHPHHTAIWHAACPPPPRGSSSVPGSSLLCSPLLFCSQIALGLEQIYWLWGRYTTRTAPYRECPSLDRGQTGRGNPAGKSALDCKSHVHRRGDGQRAEAGTSYNETVRGFTVTTHNPSKNELYPTDDSLPASDRFRDRVSTRSLNVRTYLIT